MNSSMTIAENANCQKRADNGIALGGSILITALVMVASVRWAASDAGYGSLLTSLGIAAGASLLLIAALWMLPGAEQSKRHSSTSMPSPVR
jgi:hypothetical protein